MLLLLRLRLGEALPDHACGVLGKNPRQFVWGAAPADLFSDLSGQSCAARRHACTALPGRAVARRALTEEGRERVAPRPDARLVGRGIAINAMVVAISPRKLGSHEPRRWREVVRTCGSSRARTEAPPTGNRQFESGLLQGRVRKPSVPRERFGSFQITAWG
jgi:hypothetical protein